MYVDGSLDYNYQNPTPAWPYQPILSGPDACDGDCVAFFTDTTFEGCLEVAFPPLQVGETCRIRLVLPDSPFYDMARMYAS